MKWLTNLSHDYDMIENEMIWNDSWSYDIWPWYGIWHATRHNMFSINYHTSTDKLYVCVAQIMCDDMMWWCIDLWFHIFFLTPHWFSKKKNIFRRRWMKQNSMARRLDLEDRKVFLNNYVLYLSTMLYKYCLINCDQWHVSIQTKFDSTCCVHHRALNNGTKIIISNVSRNTYWVVQRNGVMKHESWM